MGLFNKSTPNTGRSRLEKLPRSNVRGRISGPIPIQEDEVSTQFPAPEAQGALSKLSDPATQQASAVASTTTAGNAVNISAGIQSGPSQHSMIQTPVRHNTTPVILISSTMAEGPSKSPSKKPSLKAAIEKLFFKRKQKQGNNTASNSRTQLGPSGEPDRRRSDLITVRRDITVESERQRSESFPITEFNKALRSHSIGPEDYKAIHSVRNSFQSGPAGPAFKRQRAVSTSRSAISSRLPNESLDMLGLSPRPASHHAIDDPESIGRAVSIDAPASHRRSRSLPQLQDVTVVDGQVHVRKRSEEIRFWRDSYNPRLLSPDLSVFNRDDIGTIGTGTIATTETRETIDTTQLHNSRHEATVPVSSPPLSFNFEPLRTAGMTSALSMEERMSALEVRNQKLERLVARLFHLVSGIDNYTGPHDRSGSIVPTAPPTPSTPMALADTARSVSSNTTRDTDLPSSNYSVSEPSNASFDDGKAFLDAPRPISTATVRGATGSRTSREGQITAEQYANMKMLLDAERAERRALEIRVTRLTETVEMLTRNTQPDYKPSSGTQTTISIFEPKNDDNDEDPPSPKTEAKAKSVERPETEIQSQSHATRSLQVPHEINAALKKGASGPLTLDKPKTGKQRKSKKQKANADL